MGPVGDFLKIGNRQQEPFRATFMMSSFPDLSVFMDAQRTLMGMIALHASGLNYFQKKGGSSLPSLRIWDHFKW